MIKQLILIIITSAGLIFSSYGQAGAKWSVNGNSGTTSTNFVGTIDSRPLVLSTNSLERARILPTGYFGIGTSFPTSMLTVNGVVESLTGGVKFPDGTVQTTAAVTLVFTIWTLQGG